MNIAQKLRDKRIEMGVTHQQLAVKAGLHASTVARIEGGGDKISLSTLVKLAQVLGVSAAWLVE
jgi:transcriptional regulator with XRE-family HTH domain